MKTTSLIPTVMLLFSLGLFCTTNALAAKAASPAASSKKPSAGTIKVIEKSADKLRAFILKPGKTEGVIVSTGNAVFEGDTIRTDEGVRVQVELSDGSNIFIGPGANVQMKSFMVDQSKGKRRISVKALQGAIRFLITRLFKNKASGSETAWTESGVTVETHTAISGVKGTDFAVTIGAADTEIAVLEGTVSVKNAIASVIGEVLVGANQVSRVARNAAPTAPVALSAELRDKLLRATTPASVLSSGAGLPGAALAGAAPAAALAGAASAGAPAGTALAGAVSAASALAGAAPVAVAPVAAAPSAAAPAAPAVGGCVTAACHKGMLKTKNIHPAAEPCDTCHQSIQAQHPQKNIKTFKLTEETPGLCYQCHAKFGALKHTHPPVKDGMCTACHNPHDSAEPKLLAQPMKDLCVSCHPDKTGYKFAHGPASTGDCTFCHNPHESKYGALLVKEGKELCFTCHADMADEIKRKFVHPALEGGCTSCHNPHGSSAKKFFSAEGSALCFQCHPAIEAKLASAKTIHPPIKTERGCASCHAPHASDAPKLLSKSGKELCLDCHKNFIKKNQTVLHGPIKDGQCTPCHDPHGSPDDNLLIKSFSSEFYVSYSDAEFPLCFSCHNRDMLKFPTTSYATGFRDGENNLHYLHVNRKDRGKSCKACHLIHAGENPKLIADKVPFSKWNLPLNFTKTETGGGCTPGCHQKYLYDRKKPAKGAPVPADKGAGKNKPRAIK